MEKSLSSDSLNDETIHEKDVDNRSTWERFSELARENPLDSIFAMSPEALKSSSWFNQPPIIPKGVHLGEKNMFDCLSLAENDDEISVTGTNHESNVLLRDSAPLPLYSPTSDTTIETADFITETNRKLKLARDRTNRFRNQNIEHIDFVPDNPVASKSKLYTIRRAPKWLTEIRQNYELALTLTLDQNVDRYCVNLEDLHKSLSLPQPLPLKWLLPNEERETFHHDDDVPKVKPPMPQWYEPSREHGFSRCYHRIEKLRKQEESDRERQELYLEEQGVKIKKAPPRPEHIFGTFSEKEMLFYNKIKAKNQQKTITLEPTKLVPNSTENPMIVEANVPETTALSPTLPSVEAQADSTIAVSTTTDDSLESRNLDDGLNVSENVIKIAGAVLADILTHLEICEKYSKNNGKVSEKFILGSEPYDAKKLEALGRFEYPRTEISDKTSRPVDVSHNRFKNYNANINSKSLQKSVETGSIEGTNNATDTDEDDDVVILEDIQTPEVESSNFTTLLPKLNATSRKRRLSGSSDTLSCAKRLKHATTVVIDKELAELFAEIKKQANKCEAKTLLNLSGECVTTTKQLEIALIMRVLSCSEKNFYEARINELTDGKHSIFNTVNLILPIDSNRSILMRYFNRRFFNFLKKGFQLFSWYVPPRCPWGFYRTKGNSLFGIPNDRSYKPIGTTWYTQPDSIEHLGKVQSFITEFMTFELFLIIDLHILHVQRFYMTSVENYNQYIENNESVLYDIFVVIKRHRKQCNVRTLAFLEAVYLTRPDRVSAAGIIFEKEFKRLNEVFKKHLEQDNGSIQNEMDYEYYGKAVAALSHENIFEVAEETDPWYMVAMGSEFSDIFGLPDTSSLMSKTLIEVFKKALKKRQEQFVNELNVDLPMILNFRTWEYFFLNPVNRAPKIISTYTSLPQIREGVYQEKTNIPIRPRVSTLVTTEKLSEKYVEIYAELEKSLTTDNDEIMFSYCNELIDLMMEAFFPSLRQTYEEQNFKRINGSRCSVKEVNDMKTMLGCFLFNEFVTQWEKYTVWMDRSTSYSKMMSTQRPCFNTIAKFFNFKTFDQLPIHLQRASFVLLEDNFDFENLKLTQKNTDVFLKSEFKSLSGTALGKLVPLYCHKPTEPKKVLTAEERRVIEPIRNTVSFSEILKKILNQKKIDEASK